MKALRINAGLTQTKAAEQIGVTTVTLCKWESHTTFPTLDQLMKMCSIYGCTLDDIRLPDNIAKLRFLLSKGGQMTVREFIKKVLEEAPDLDANVYVNQPVNDIESESYVITGITNNGNNDEVTIEIELYR